MLFISHPREVKAAARSALEQATYNPKKLALIYAGVSSGVALLTTIINYIVSSRIDAFGGLSGLGMRSILSTVQFVLPFLAALLVPFWDIGMLRAGMGFMRKEQVSPNTLTAGFRRFGAVFCLQLLRGILLVLIVLAAANVGSIIFSFTPWATPIMNLSETVAITGTLTDEMIMQVMPYMLPLYGISLAVFCLVAIPFFYRLRMAEFILMDQPVGAIAAILFSRQFMRGYRFMLFKIDLSFWWYYLSALVISAICFLPDYLSLAGVQLPLSADVVFFLCYSLYVLLQFLLCWKYSSYIQTTYAFAYDSLIPRAPKTPESPAEPAENM